MELEILCMKKKILCLVVIVIAFLICCIVYFKPISLSDVAEDNNQIKMVYSELGVKMVRHTLTLWTIRTLP